MKIDKKKSKYIPSFQNMPNEKRIELMKHYANGGRIDMLAEKLHQSGYEWINATKHLAIDGFDFKSKYRIHKYKK